MPSQTPKDPQLLIRCPSCGHRFKVREQLRGIKVTCSGCENHFLIDDEVIVRGKRIYPGDHLDAGLDRFQRISPSPSSPTKSPHPVAYGAIPSSAFMLPLSPIRIILGIIGVGAAVLMALLLMFGAGGGGILDGMSQFNRLLMASFVGLVTTILLVYANPRARFKGLFVGLLIAVGLLALAYFSTLKSRYQVTHDELEDDASFSEMRPAPTTAEADQILRDKIGIGPLQDEIDRLKVMKKGQHAVGVWLRGLGQMNHLLVRDYMIRIMHADPSGSHLFPRADGNFLMVVSGVPASLDNLREIVKPLGRIVNIYPNLSVIEVKVNNENFTEGSFDKLINKNDPAFYELNKRELDSIDAGRVHRAVKRLAEAPPTKFRNEITQRLILILSEDGLDFKGDICRALSVWSEKPGLASAAALIEIKKLMATKSAVPADMIALMVKEKNSEVIPFLDQLWTADPTSWERIYGDIGPSIEPTMIERFANEKEALRFSAAQILGRIGGRLSLRAFDEDKKDKNPEMSVLIEQARKSINERLAK